LIALIIDAHHRNQQSGVSNQTTDAMNQIP